MLRLRLCTFEGVRNMFYEYAYAQADQLEKMQLELYAKYGIAWNDQLANADWDVSHGGNTSGDNNDVDSDDDDSGNDSLMDSSGFHDDTTDDTAAASSDAPCDQPTQPSQPNTASSNLRRSTRARTQTSFYGMPVSHL